MILRETQNQNDADDANDAESGIWYRDILKEEIGEVFVKVLEDAGVYKCTEEGRKAFERFINTL